MKPENVITKISAILAGIVVFVFACGMYLSAKGFNFTPDGQIYFNGDAQKQESNLQKVELDKNSLPRGKMIGSADAPFSIYEFSSFNCVHCADFHNKVFPLIKKEYIDTNKANLVFVDFPLDVKSMQGALLADCIPDDKYFGYLDEVFENQAKWGMSSDYLSTLRQYAIDNGANENELTACLDNKAKSDKIMQARQKIMNDLHIMGTPSFIVVKGNMHFMLQGAPSFENLSEILNKN